MRQRELIGMLAGIILLVNPQVRAGIVFDDNPITTPPPVVVTGDGTITANDPTKTPQDDGFSIDGLSVKVTANASPTRIEAHWAAERVFNYDPTNCDPFDIRIFGNTDVTITGGTVTVLIIGTIDDDIDVSFISNDIKGPTANPVPLSWDTSDSVAGLMSGMHKLNLEVGVEFAASQGDMVTITSHYSDTCNCVPEPRAIFLFGIGALILPIMYWRQPREGERRGKGVKSRKGVGTVF
jgi:hypothetical protein